MGERRADVRNVVGAAFVIMAKERVNAKSAAAVEYVST
jgi:hypothetical protein